MADLLSNLRPAEAWHGEGVLHLPGFADAAAMWAALHPVLQTAPFRHLVTPGGKTMSVSMTNCGRVGWVSDRTGYRYDKLDPLSGKPWPDMPDALRDVAVSAATAFGAAAFNPDACLINCYEVGARLTPHQDRDEQDLGQPVVSVSLGLPGRFVIGGTERSGPKQTVLLEHGDALVFGRSARLAYHGVLPVKASDHPMIGARRISLTFRKAG
ncbi:MAG: DNA oxidative demethylase AlkB [Alphaproteobacteria bacterium]|nr:DNA oxidative demethylase AlkB [Alphaproteobacteria bacterium]MBU2084508.1 DNA oxidative demethylase AlkB [Alphaproteobacteria bacterium]MBU2142516.1 DNA oxidative demethylase AlkB [Alphaproteobacteria bacterium]MBU2197731.1 DNA oxidative demethylase AlkB [Alphaproteobacteria bacterium]